MRYVLLVVLALACGYPYEPTPGVTEFDPPPVYQEWWRDAEACAGRSGQFDRLRWYKNEGCVTHNTRGECIYGMWRSDHTIYLTDTGVLYQPLVTHEMLHDILGDGSHDHPAFDACVPQHQ